MALLDRRISWGIFVGFLLLYLATLCPTVYFGDSGEISGAIFRGGVIHPPGYPLFSLLGRVFLVLVPYGEPAFRVGVLVALAAAASVAMLYQIARELRHSQTVAACLSGLFGVSYTFWSQSVRVEVYSLHVLLCSLTLLFTLRYRTYQSQRDFRLACLALSLGLAHHLTIVLMLPGLLILAGKEFWSAPKLGQRLGACLPLFLIGPAFYGLLPLWAKDSTLYNSGDPSTPLSLWHHMSARLYQGNLQIPQSTASLVQARTVALQSLPAPLWAAVVVGVWVLGRRDRGLLLGLLSLAVPCIAYNLCYDIPDIAAYYLLVLLIAALLLGETLTALFVRFPIRRTGFVLAAPLALALMNFPSCNLHEALFVREFARQKLLCCDPSAVLIAEGDQDIFPTDYVHLILGVRPDVLVLAREHISGMFFHTWETRQWYLRRLRQQGVAAPLGFARGEEERQKQIRDSYLIGLLEGPLSGRPIHMTFIDVPKEGIPMETLKAWWAPRYALVPQGLLIALYPLQPAPDPKLLAEKNRQLWARITLPNLAGVEVSQEMSPDYLVGHYVSMLSNYGGLWELAGEPEKASQVYQALYEWDPIRARPILQKMGPLAQNALR